MRTRLRLLNTVVLLAAEAVALVALVGLGDRRPFDLGLPLAGLRVDDDRIDAWRHATSEDALASVARWVAVVVVAWLIAVTLVCAIAALTDRAARPAGIVGGVGHGPVGAIRRLVDRAVITGVIAGSFVAAPSAHAATNGGVGSDPPIVTIVRDGRAGTLDALPADPAAPPSGVPPALGTSPSTAADASTATPAPASTDAARGALSDVPGAPASPNVAGPTIGARSVVVAPGDDLWELAAREVARERGVDRRELADPQIAAYWVAVCDANRASLPSGDPNLIHPGESVVLPRVT